MNRTHRVIRASFYLSLALPFAALACGDSFTSGSGDGGDDGGGIILGDGGEGHDATTDGASSDAHHDGPADGGTKHDGSIVDAGMPDVSCQPTYQECTLSSGTSCIATAPDTTHGLFVAPPPQGQPGSCGAEAAPCDTVSSALPYLSGSKNIIYVAEGTYTDQVTLPAGVTVQGNWLYMGGGQWSHDCVFPPKTVIEASAGSNRVITVSYSAGSSTLDSLTLTNATTAGTGISQYGIFASSSGTTAGALVLTNVSINVAAGGPGASGVQGGDGGPPPTTCMAGGTLQNGTPGGSGNGAPAGSYGPSGYSPSTGAVGTQGGVGSNGAAAPACGATGGPQCVATAYPLVNSNYTSNSACCIVNGGAGTTCNPCTGVTPVMLQGGTGTSGCGSTGSGPGAPGSGGGASIGLFVWNETVTVNGSGLTTAGGGPGGNGGPGGPVYDGGAGAPGPQSTQLVSSTCSQQTIGGNPTCVEQYRPLDGGSPGGSGFSGGIGGQGGGGNGGDSYCWYVGVGSGGKVNADSFATANCHSGPGGPGGNQGGGTSQGTTGASLQHN